MDERVKFIAAYLREELSITRLSSTFGVSRKTAYKWIARYAAGGVAELLNRSRRPQSNPNAMSREVASLVVTMRKQHPFWGPKKLLAMMGTALAARDGSSALRARSSSSVSTLPKARFRGASPDSGGRSGDGHGLLLRAVSLIRPSWRHRRRALPLVSGEEPLEVLGADPDGVRDPGVGKGAAGAEPVDGHRANAKHLSCLAHGQQRRAADETQAHRVLPCGCRAGGRPCTLSASNGSKRAGEDLAALDAPGRTWRLGEPIPKPRVAGSTPVSRSSQKGRMSSGFRRGTPALGASGSWGEPGGDPPGDPRARAYRVVE